MNGYLDAMRRYGRFRGRAARAEYWGFVGITAVILVAALIADGSRGNGFNRSGELFVPVAVLVHLLPSWAVSVRRLHDTNRSGWLLLIGIIPLIGTLLLAVWACEAGTPNINQYGPEPHGEGTPRGYPPATAPQPAAGDMIAEIERLARLKASGSLSEVEFEVLKAKALGRG